MNEDDLDIPTGDDAGSGAQDALGEDELDEFVADEAFDADGNPLESEIEGEDAPVVEAPAPPARTAPAFNLAGMTAEQREVINDLAVTDPVGAFEKFMEFRDTQSTQRHRLTDFHAGTLEQDAPEFMRLYGGHVREAIAEVNKHQPGSDDAINVGVANALLQELRASKDIRGTVAKFHAALSESGTSGGRGKANTPGAQSSARPTAKVLPPSQRVTSPTLAGGSARQGAAATGNNNRSLSNKENVLQNIFGADKETASRAARAQ